MEPSITIEYELFHPYIIEWNSMSAWFDETPDKLLKNFTLEKRTFAFPKATAKSPIKVELKLESKLSQNANSGLGAINRSKSPWKEIAALKKDDYDQMLTFVSALDPALTINPASFDLMKIRKTLGIRLRRITAVPSLGRDYYKFWDILQHLPVVPKDFKCPDTGPCLVSAQVAEGPGGFAQALIHYRKRNFPKQYERNKIVAMSLTGKQAYSKEKTRPLQGSKSFTQKKFLQLYSANTGKVKIFRIFDGKDGTGDLTTPDNLKAFAELFAKEKANLMTGDGSVFPPEHDPRGMEQERGNTHLIFSEVFTALAVQKVGGNAVIKFFDTDTHASADLLYLLWRHYENVALVKPVTSRPQSNERYAFCQKFQGADTALLADLMKVQTQWYQADPVAGTKGGAYASQILSRDSVPKDFLNVVKASDTFFQKWREPVMAQGYKLYMSLKGNSNKKKQDALKGSLIQRICRNILFAVDWCQANGVFLEKQYYLLRSPDRRPFRKDNPCYLALGQNKDPKFAEYRKRGEEIAKERAAEKAKKAANRAAKPKRNNRKPPNKGKANKKNNKNNKKNTNKKENTA
jgi:hypothetical protein